MSTTCKCASPTSRRRARYSGSRPRPRLTRCSTSSSHGCGMGRQSQTRPLEVLVVHDFDEYTSVPVVKRLQAEFPELQLHRNTLERGVLNAIKSGLAAARAPYGLVTMGYGSDDAGDS